MPVNSVGEFFIEDRALVGGLRQDLSFSDLRYTAFRNVHVYRRNAITKRKGYRRLNSSDITGTPDIKAGLDAHFVNGSQAVLVCAGTDVWLFSNATRAFTAQSKSLDGTVPSMFMFGNEAIILTATDEHAYNGSAWNALTGSPPNGALGTVHNNRIIRAGDSTNPHLFYYSGVRNRNSWDTTHDFVVVTVPLGEEITGVGSLGTDLVVFTRHSTLLYWQNPNSPGDWDRVDISNMVGNVAHHSYTEISHLPFGMAVFWADEGPMLLYRLGNERPVMRPLWEFIYDMVQGRTSNSNAEGVLDTRWANIVSGYQPSIQEVRFAATKVGSSENNVLICFDLRTLLAFIAGNVEAPAISIKDNVTTNIYPGDALFNIRIADATGLPSATGRDKQFAGRNGIIYELDQGTKDDEKKENTAIPMFFTKSGYSGAEDGIGEIEKVVTNLRISATQDVNYAVNADVSADGGQNVGTVLIDLDAGLGAWSDGGLWTEDPSLGTWNGAVVKAARGDLGARGKVFELSVYDQGGLSGDWEMDRIVIEGLVYERQ